MRKTAIALAMVLALSTVLTPTSPALANQRTTQEMMREVLPLYEEGAAIIASGQDPNERSLTEKLTFRDSKFKRIIQACFEIMADSEAMELLTTRDESKKAIADMQLQIAKAQRDMIAAPEENWNPLADTKGSLQKKIEQLRERIAEQEKTLESAKAAVLKTAQDRGVPLTQAQIDTMLSAVDGKDIASILSVAENIAQIQKNIEEKLGTDEMSTDLLQIYTGMYMMANYTYLEALEQALSNMPAYLEKLNNVREEAKKLQQNAIELKKTSSPADKKILDTNIAANKRTINAANLYEKYLLQQQKHLTKLHGGASKHTAISVNTHKTVRTSVELLNLMKTTEADYKRLLQFQTPDVSLLYDDKLKNEFEAITSKLKEE